MPTIISFLISFISAVLFTPLCITLGSKLGITDQPNKRKIHSKPIPRTGGIAISLAFLLSFLIYNRFYHFNNFVISGILIFIVMGIFDDKYNLDFKIKFVFQFLGSFLIVFPGRIRIENLGDFFGLEQFDPGVFIIPISIFYILSVANSINFSDGLDGLLSGICLLIFSFIGLLAYQTKNPTVLLMSVSTVGVLLGFLRYNTFPARIFLGDTGSLLLGSLAAATTIMLTQKNSIYSPVLSLFILGFPLTDALFVTLERYKNGRSPFKPDKNHFHHKLLKIGFSHQSSVLFIYLLQAFFIFTAFALRFKSSAFLIGIYFVLTGSILFFTTIVKKVDFNQMVHQKYIRIYYSNIKDKINRNFICQLFIYSISFLSIVFFFSDISFAKGDISLAIYSFIFFLLIILAWFFQRTKVLFLNCLAFFFLGSYFIYMVEYGEILYKSIPLIAISNIFFIILGVFFMLANFFDLEKSYYDPIMYLIFFIVLIGLELFKDILNYYIITLIVAKIILLSMTIDLVIHKNKERLVLITSAALFILSSNIIKVLFL